MRSFLYKVQFILIIIFVFPTISYAATPLHELSPGSLITFSSKQWVILDQIEDGTTYIILNSNDGDRAFDPDNTNLFNPDDDNNIGYYLNSTFYNSLSQKDLILDHSWEIKYRNDSGSQPNVNAKIALISCNERVTTYKSFLPSTTFDWWTRTPSTLSNRVWMSYSYENVFEQYAKSPRGIRPALYLKSGLMVSGESNNVFEAVPPSTPIGLTATPLSYNQIQLYWTANTEPDLAGYIIYRNYTEVARVGIESTSFTDSDLKPNTNYSYSIEAYNSFDLFSGISSIVTVRTLLMSSSLKTPSPSVMASDISTSTSMVMYSFGGLLALALGIKLCPWVITIVKTVFLK